ncbi:MAG: DUF4340 domain-containing protein [Treponema sp.]|nr:DUF4340 domain-containing protein [Treponema sp.]
MIYKKKLYILTALIAVLVLLYTGNLIFTSGAVSRQSSFVWLDSKIAEKAGRIAMLSVGNDDEQTSFELLKQNDKWFVLNNDKTYPARQTRIKDFLNLLTNRSSWQTRSTNASSHERFGLDDRASRITIYGDNSFVTETVLLDLLLGNDDYIKNETYYRKADQNEVRSGDSSIKTYLTGSVSGWYNLRLISGSGGEQVDIANVQRVTVTSPSETQIFSRRNRTWVITGIQIANPDIPAIENYIRTLLNAEGDGFDDNVSIDDTSFEHSRIVIEISNARIITVSINEGDESGRRLAKVNGGPYEGYVYSIPSWSAGRLFREGMSFEHQQ